MRRFVYSFLSIIIVACSSTYELDLPGAERMMFCNCLFSPDTTWKAELGYTYAYSKIDYEDWIENAQVCIISDTNDTIQLEHYRKGEYYNRKRRPEFGKEYRLQAIVEGDTLTSGKSSIPLNIDFSLVSFDEHPGLVNDGFGTLSEVSDIELGVSVRDENMKRVLIRAMLFDTIRSSRYYTFNRSVFDSVLHAGLDSIIVDKTGFLDGDTIWGQYNMYNLLSLIFDKDLTYKQIDAIMDAAYIGETIERKENAFTKIDCFSSSPHFLNFDYEDYSLIGSFDVSENFHAYVWDFLEGECWFQCKALSEEAYQYYKSYITQISNRTDYNTLSEPVYSNITNGTGIFAGYTEQMIRIK